MLANLLLSRSALRVATIHVCHDGYMFLDQFFALTQLPAWETPLLIGRPLTLCTECKCCGNSSDESMAAFGPFT